MKLFCRLLVLMAFVGLCVSGTWGERLHFNSAGGYGKFRHATTGGIIFNSTMETEVADTVCLGSECRGFRLAFRLSDLNSHPYGKYEYRDKGGEIHKVASPGWSLIVGSNEGKIKFHFRRIQKEEVLTSRDAILVTAVRSDSDTIGSKVLDKGMNMFDGVNAYRLSFYDGVMTLACGDREYTPIISFESTLRKISYFGYRPGDGGCIKVTDINFNSDGNEVVSPDDILSETEIADILSGSLSGLAGYWMEYDRSFDESTLRMGGTYLLALIPEGEGFGIRYISGAKKNPGMWIPGMIKGRLTPSPFDGVYEVEWLDAAGQSLTNNVRAQSDGDLLTISFPYHNSILRLRRLHK